MLVKVAPWYAHIANYLVTGVPIRKYVLEEKLQGILSHCHENACGGHFASQKTTMRVVPCKHNDHRVVLKFLKENIFSRFGVPKAIISDGHTHFCNKPFETLLAKYGVKHKVDRKDWSIKFLDSLWVYRIAYKTILGMSPYRLVYDKAYHLSMELEYKAWWAIKKLNMDLSRARVLLYDSKLHIFPGKLKSRWIRPFTIHQVHSNGVVELLNSNRIGSFKVNGHCLKPFVEPYSRDNEEFILLDPHQA
ncbi:hypothetical protein CK203_086595 [Vitis vinifera]|uniref:Integrase catalytic domain-containing protein n=1 Tax=Vitis vinifera TaxID=29760 RepID=A0A438FJC6_VITVI|nr:hypothetical protein CK203_086595 [Vitis vinifera]